MSLFDSLSKEKALKGSVLSDDWLALCKVALPLNYYKFDEITELLAIRCGLGAVVAKDYDTLITKEKMIEMVWWLNTHCFVHADLKPHSLRAAFLSTRDFRRFLEKYLSLLDILRSLQKSDLVKKVPDAPTIVR